MRKICFALQFLFAYTLPLLVSAQFEYVTNSDDSSITITGYTGPDTVVIPTNINGLPVTDIGEAAFSDTSVGSVTISETVTNIGIEAFDNCQYLSNVVFPNSLTSVGGDAFVGSALTSVRIPPGLINVGEGAFAVGSSLTNVTIDYGIADIAPETFGGDGFSSVVIPASVTNIGDSAFSSVSLTNIFFAGNAPDVTGYTFALINPPQFEGVHTYYIATAYYLPGTTGWDEFTNETFLESNVYHNPTNISLPLVLWNPTIQATGTNFRIQNGQYGFDIVATNNLPIAIEACDDLSQSNWVVLQRLTFTNGLFHFSEPFQTNAPARFYRIGFP